MITLAIAAWMASAAPALPRALAAFEERLSLPARAAGRLAGPVDDPPFYRVAERAVSNWRREAASDLDPGAIALLAALVGAERPVITRCVRLNNYWCIKRARWNGEVGADEEGHTGFATAENGADAAAVLLRRYYLDFGRRSALDIVRRWAPAECRSQPAGAALASLPLGAPLAVRGIQNTLRARYLARSRGGVRSAPAVARGALAASPPPAPLATAAASVGPALAIASTETPPPAAAAPARGTPARPPAAARRPTPAGRASVIPLRPLPVFRVPDIAAGMGERPRPAPPAAVRRQAPPPRVATASAAVAPSRRVATTPAVAPQRVAAALPPTPPTSSTACASEELRQQNYAARIVRDLDGVGPADDLRLFDDAGAPLPNLAAVMLAMSAFELGVLRASADLVTAAIERLPSRGPDAPPADSMDGR